MENVRVYEIPECRMASSGGGMFGDGVLEKFSAWFSSFGRTMFPRDFLWFDQKTNQFFWYYMLDDDQEAPPEFETVPFRGGLYAVATDIDGRDNAQARDAITAFIETSGCFRKDTSRAELGNVITPPSAQKVLGYNQMDYYTPIKII